MAMGVRILYAASMIGVGLYGWKHSLTVDQWLVTCLIGHLLHGLFQIHSGAYGPLRRWLLPHLLLDTCWFLGIGLLAQLQLSVIASLGDWTAAQLLTSVWLLLKTGFLPWSAWLDLRRYAARLHLPLVLHHCLFLLGSIGVAKGAEVLPGNALIYLWLTGFALSLGLGWRFLSWKMLLPGVTGTLGILFVNSSPLNSNQFIWGLFILLGLATLLGGWGAQEPSSRLGSEESLRQTYSKDVAFPHVKGWVVLWALVVSCGLIHGFFIGFHENLMIYLVAVDTVVIAMFASSQAHMKAVVTREALVKFISLQALGSLLCFSGWMWGGPELIALIICGLLVKSSFLPLGEWHADLWQAFAVRGSGAWLCLAVLLSNTMLIGLWLTSEPLIEGAAAEVLDGLLWISLVSHGLLVITQEFRQRALAYGLSAVFCWCLLAIRYSEPSASVVQLFGGVATGYGMVTTLIYCWRQRYLANCNCFGDINHRATYPFKGGSLLLSLAVGFGVWLAPNTNLAVAAGGLFVVMVVWQLRYARLFDFDSAPLSSEIR